jgi:hypothetical protein
MNEERRYQNHEIRQILELADRPDDSQSHSLAAVDGLTAAELQEVGREVGLAPDQIARAVVEFDGRGQGMPQGRTLGMPTSVGRLVDLPRAPTDREWELLVSELRMTFGAKGEVTSHGGLREWSNGSLHAFVEPTESGYRLRLTDTMTGAVGLTFIGGFFLAFALLILVILLGKEEPGFRFVVPAFFGLIGTGMIAGTSIALPRWASEREGQMRHITGRARTLVGSPLTDDAESGFSEAE